MTCVELQGCRCPPVNTFSATRDDSEYSEWSSDDRTITPRDLASGNAQVSALARRRGGHWQDSTGPPRPFGPF